MADYPGAHARPAFYHPEDEPGSKSVKEALLSHANTLYAEALLDDIEEFINDEEGRALVQAILDRKAAAL